MIGALDFDYLKHDQSYEYPKDDKGD